MKIPFQFGHIVTGSSFINRQDEIKRLEGNFESGINTMIISPRRWGKSSLVQRVTESFEDRKDVFICSIDLFSVRTEADFAQIFARELIKQTSSRWEEWGEAVKTFLSNAVPKISFGAADASTELELNWAGKKPDLLTIYQLPETIAKKKKVRVIVCIDEFQNISYFDDPLSIQKQMRSVWQHHQSASYCLFGSKKHLLTDIFTNHSMPFYRFGDLMYLNKIAMEHWQGYISAQFLATGKKISTEIISKLVESVRSHPHYVQQLAQRVWWLTEKQADEKTLDAAIEAFLNDTSVAFIRDAENLTATQIDFLKAFCEGVREFSSADTLRNYHLGGPSNITRIRRALEQKEILDFFNAEPEFVDPAFELWLKKYFFKMPS